MAIEVLTALDKAKTQWYHFTAIIVAGMGFFTDAYDLFCISTVSKLLGRIYYYDPATGRPGTLPPTVAAVVNGIALCGALVGQLFFGWLGDKLGRKRVYGLTLLCMVMGSIASGLSFGHSAKSVLATLCFFRFWLGFGIGGDYPLSATIMSEYANTRTRGAFIAAVFAMQGFGILAGGIVSLVLSAGFKAAYPAPTFAEDPVRSTPPQADYMWRIIFMLGAVPALLTYYWRMKMPETARYTALVEGNINRATEDMNKVLGKSDQQTVNGRSQQVVNGKVLPVQDVKYGLFSREFARKHGLELLGTTSTWFLLDVAYYSQNLFQKDVFTAVGWLKDPKTMSGLDEVYKISRAQTLIALCSTVPGYWFTVFLIDRIGRFTIQLGGFFFMSVFMLSLSIPYYKLRGQKCPEGFCGGQHMTFIVLYALTFFFSNFGPNSTTFIVPAELFPARLRSTCHGISAAAGKAGSIVGAFGFLYAAQSPHKKDTDPGYRPGIGIRASLILLGVCNCLGMVFTFLVPETNGKSLEELSGENEDDGNGGPGHNTSDSNRVANSQLEV